VPFRLETARLALREMVDADLDFVAGMLGDPEVMRFYPKVCTREESRAWLERQRRRYAEDGHGLWLAEDRLRGSPLGQIGLVRQEVDGRTETEIGYLVARPHWRRGIAAEAALAIRDYAFRTLGRTRLVSLIRPENRPSQGVALKIGMIHERDVTWAGLPHRVYAIARSSEPAARAPRPGS
jgi:RimJ/RimL family protein N-acetyltransferase